MWARAAEVTFGAFLAMSSLIFPYPEPLWIFNLSVAAWIWIFSLASFYYPLRKAHLLNIFAVAALILCAFVQPDPPPPPPFQNYVVLALLLLLFTVVPSHCASPPAPWSRFYKQLQEKDPTL